LSSSSSAIGGSAWWAAMRSRMSRFQARRSICQTPSDSANRKIGSIITVGQNSGRNLSIAQLQRRTAGDRPAVPMIDASAV